MKREVETLRALAGNAHVMPVLDADHDFAWCVMPLARGDMTKFSVPLPDRTLADVLAQAAEGLAHAHDKGFVHWDIKPPNILRLGGASGEVERWVVADWGLVRNPRGMTTRLLTSDGQVIGTDGFIAPEVLQGAHENATAKADVYSLGRVALWAATGNVPLAGSEELPVGVFRQLAVHVQAKLQSRGLEHPGWQAPPEDVPDRSRGAHMARGRAGRSSPRRAGRS